MIFRIMLALVPVSLVLEYLLHVSPMWVFATAGLAIVPLAEYIRQSTEQLAERLGSAIGGLLNVTFGNMAELILAIFVLYEGHVDVVKGQITGAIIGNSLLGLGLAIVVGTFGRRHQKFNRASAGRLSSLLILAVIALLTPALFDYTERGMSGAAHATALDEKLSLGVAVVLIALYAANLVYSLVTHEDVFSDRGAEGAEGKENHAKQNDEKQNDAKQNDEKRQDAKRKDEQQKGGQQKGGQQKGGQQKGGHKEQWAMWKVFAVLVGATAVTAVESELVSGALESASTTLGVTTFFLGVTVLAIVGNAAEYVSAVYFARQDRMDLALNITVGSTIQIALLVAPLLVLVSYFIGHPMDLVFANPLELIAIAGVAFVVNAIAHDGETTWFEGVLLLGVYTVLAMAFFFVTPPP